MKNSMAPQQTQNKSISHGEQDSVLKSVDYLKELRIKREQEEKDGVYKQNKSEKYFQKYMNDPSLNDYERVELVKRKAEQMEERARMEEKLIKFDPSGQG